MNHQATAIVIPARLASTRFPRKMLHPLAGKPLLEHVWRRCAAVVNAEALFIATDSQEIAEVATAFGAEVIMTRADHVSGTDRIAEVARFLDQKGKHFSHFLNVQGDEPLIEISLVEELIDYLKRESSLEMITAATPLVEEGEQEDPNLVKVVLAKNGKALYFSRSPLPYHRDKSDLASRVTPLLHLGIYGFSKEALYKFVSFSPSALEQCEKLEQLRALENGMSIKVIQTSYRALGVDTLEDAKRIEQLLLREKY